MFMDAVLLVMDADMVAVGESSELSYALRSCLWDSRMLVMGVVL